MPSATWVHAGPGPAAAMMALAGFERLLDTSASGLAKAHGDASYCRTRSDQRVTRQRGHHPRVALRGGAQ